MVKNTCNNPVFICGMQRSGTTALWKALTEHSKLKSQRWLEKEHWFFQEFFQGRHHNANYREGTVDSLYKKNAIEFINYFMTQNFAGIGGRYLTGNPNNVYYIDQLLEYIPNAKFVLMIRHPYSVVWSRLYHPDAYEVQWRSTEDTNNILTEDITLNSEYWSSIAQIAIKAIRGYFGKSVLVIRHEDLVIDPGETIKNIFCFINEPFEVVVEQSLLNKIANSYVPPYYELENNMKSRFLNSSNEILKNTEFCNIVYATVQKEMDLLKFEKDAVFTSLKSNEVKNESKMTKIKQRVHIVSVKTLKEDCQCESFLYGETINLEITIQAVTDCTDISISFQLKNNHGLSVCGTTTFDEHHQLPNLIAGNCLTVHFLFRQIMKEGKYTIDITVNGVSDAEYLDNEVLVERREACSLYACSTKDRPIWYIFHNETLISHRVEDK